MDSSLSKYKNCRKWVLDKKKDHYSWDDIKLCCVESENAESEFAKLKVPGMIVPMDMTYAEWLSFVEDIQSEYIEYSEENVNGIYASTSEIEYSVPVGSHDAWPQYEKLLKGELDGKRRMTDISIRNICDNSHWILNRIRKETRNLSPQKGLVMGSVQSGKTANMIGLVTMAAHYDWNFIIILSGSIENLRVQTRNRFVKDLQRCQDADWHFLESSSNEDFLNDISLGKQISTDEVSLNFSQPNTIDRSPYHETYIMICLKQASRLRKLIHWLHHDPHIASRLRIMIIDDEADQASINTAKMTDDEIKNRTTINQLIINLANGLDEDGIKLDFQALNYLAYTATPYANVLNEAYRESLYPKDFVTCLPENNSYFGSKVIWGSKRDEKYPGLDIVRKIEKSACDTIKEIGKGQHIAFPDVFLDAVAWFFCCVAAMRCKGWNKPISMLIHTASGNKAHFCIYEDLKKWINDNRSNGIILERCKSIYEKETNKFNYSKFVEGFSEYEHINTMDRSYPRFEDILTELENILTVEPKSIEIESGGELKYCEDGIHLCVDNCRARKYADNEETQLRIIYPDDDKLSAMKKAPAFIVIGGNTLSRGLTIEGLVSTFFSRSTNQADTLMQMARWYGYRKNYELFPRIWMSSDSIEKYKVLAQVEEKLRKTIGDYKKMGKNPGKVYPPVMSTSAISRFLLTSKNKSQNMVPYNMDFSGDSYELTEFPNELADLKSNLLLTEDFLRKLEKPVASMIYPDRSYIWRSVASIDIISFLRHIKMVTPSNFEKEMGDFFSWMEQENEKGNYLYWNVAVCGSSIHKGEKWTITGTDHQFGKVERTKLNRISSYIDIGSMRSGRDGICDIEINEETDMSLIDQGKKGTDIEVIRGKLGYSDVPLLLIYCIDKNGGKNTENKSQLNTDIDLIGYSVILGGDSSNTDHINSVVVSVPGEENDDEVEE